MYGCQGQRATWGTMGQTNWTASSRDPGSTSKRSFAFLIGRDSHSRSLPGVFSHAPSPLELRYSHCLLYKRSHLLKRAEQKEDRSLGPWCLFRATKSTSAQLCLLWVPHQIKPVRWRHCNLVSVKSARTPVRATNRYKTDIKTRKINLILARGLAQACQQDLWRFSNMPQCC